jgi:hypothetical protein
MSTSHVSYDEEADPPKVCDRCYKLVVDPAEHGLYLCPLEPRRDIVARRGFEARFDIGLGRYVTGWGDIKKGMREEKLDFRDHPSPGARSMRNDKENERKKRIEARRRG